MMGVVCPDYTGVACVNGTCPIANRDTYIEYGVPVVWDCDKCNYYRGCDDCAWCDEEGECMVVRE